jgi:hypothetical protein
MDKIKKGKKVMDKAVLNFDLCDFIIDYIVCKLILFLFN